VDLELTSSNMRTQAAKHSTMLVDKLLSEATRRCCSFESVEKKMGSRTEDIMGQSIPRAGTSRVRPVQRYVHLGGGYIQKAGTSRGPSRGQENQENQELQEAEG
jgi:uncharacterized protein (DUF3084 family)